MFLRPTFQVSISRTFRGLSVVVQSYTRYEVMRYVLSTAYAYAYIYRQLDRFIAIQNGYAESRLLLYRAEFDNCKGKRLD